MSKRRITAAIASVGAVITFSIAAPVTTIAAPAPSTVAGISGPEVPIPTTLLGQPVAAADAGNCAAPGVCGRIVNWTGRGQVIIQHWGGGIARTLQHGQYSTNYYPDTDGFRASGCVRLYENNGNNLAYHGRFCNNVAVQVHDRPYPTYWELHPG
jgi:hypothetical protein